MNWWQIVLCMLGGVTVASLLLSGWFYGRLLEKWSKHPAQFLKSPRGRMKRVDELRKRYELGAFSLLAVDVRFWLFLSIGIVQCFLIGDSMNQSMDAVRLVFCVVTFCMASCLLGHYLARVRLAKWCLKELTGAASLESLNEMEMEWSRGKEEEE